MSELWLFGGALAVAYLVPGPDMILLLQLGALRGRRHALAAAAGLAAARSAHVALAGFGLAALMRTHPAAFDLVRILGAAYLVWLGVGILRASSLAPEAGGVSAPGPAFSHVHAARAGFLTNLLNPKALLFCSVLLPQFVGSGSANVAGRFALLGVVLVLVGATFDVLYVLAGGGIGRWIARRPLAARVQRWLFGWLLVGFGARLALATRLQ
ncbi:LysE family translocator [Aquamicrobium sp. LC103]|uniref:LysE family translocator n=1 Tax=Aquamicrobium sp. LC103 TaxID=1120658 RepID=UPI00063E8C2C|nr:LysE family translocator [Aquamicrobium sp. LC103]TKT80331.1 LysE family translocator [Aquamicrobium sp. LC103]